MINIFQNILTNNRLILFLLGSILAISSLNLDKFRFDASSETLVLDNDPSYENYEAVNDRFSSSEFLVVALIYESIFTDEALNEILILENQIEDIEGVSNIISILDAPLFEQPKLSLVKSATNDKYLLEDELNLDSARKELIESPLFEELVINKSGSAVAMQINLKELDDYSLVVNKIRNVLEANSFFST